MFKSLVCGETIPPKNIHAVSVSIPTMKDILSYEEGKNTKITSGYPRFVLHPYLKKLASYLTNKYELDKEIVLVSSIKFANIISKKYGLNQEICFNEEFGIVLVEKDSKDLQRVLRFIQHVGCNLSSRFAEDFLYEKGIINSLHVEELADEKTSEQTVLETLACAYNQPLRNISLAVSGMNAIYGALKGLEQSNKDTVVQLGWLYLDTMNIIKNHGFNSKVFYDVEELDKLEDYLKKEGKKVSAIVTEVPTNPLLLSVDLDRLKFICTKYDVCLIIDATFATPYNLDLKPYADIIIESLTKFACGNADVLMGCLILNEKSKYKKEDFSKHTDVPHIKDIQRLAYQIVGYKQRMQKVNQNTKKLVEYLKTKDYIDRVYNSPYSGVISVTFKKEFAKVYDSLDFCKGPSLGTEFTLLMPYVYLAHYDLLTCKEGREVLKQNNIPIDLLRISVGIEDIDEIKKEFDKLSDLR